MHHAPVLVQHSTSSSTCAVPVFETTKFESRRAVFRSALSSLSKKKRKFIMNVTFAPDILTCAHVDFSPGRGGEKSLFFSILGTRRPYSSSSATVALQQTESISRLVCPLFGVVHRADGSGLNGLRIRYSTVQYVFLSRIHLRIYIHIGSVYRCLIQILYNKEIFFRWRCFEYNWNWNSYDKGWFENDGMFDHSLIQLKS